MSSTASSYVALLGRVLLSSIFLLSGVMKFLHWNQNLEMMAQHGMGNTPFFLGAAAAVEILAGLALLLGFQTRWAAGVLFLSLIPVTLVMHNLWAFTGA